MRVRPCHRRGYVLVVTLGLLVLSATLLVAVGRAAVRHALQAREAGEQLQRHWGAVSCRNALLPFAEQILANAEAVQHAPVPVYRAKVQLGGQIFSVVLSDEQAKANVNSLLETASLDKASVESRLRQSLTGTGLANSIRLRPVNLPQKSKQPNAASQPGAAQPGVVQGGVVEAGVPRWITGLGQIFDNVPPQRLLSGPGAAPVDRLTCWGSGGTNVMRASEQSLLLAIGSSMSQIDVSHLIDARNARLRPRTAASAISTHAPAGAAPNAAGTDPVGRLLAEAKVTLRDRAKIPLSAGSSCHSVWIVVGDARSAWHYLVVSDESNPQKTRIESFVW